MPQNNLGVAYGQSSSAGGAAVFSPLQVDSSGNLKVVSESGGSVVVSGGTVDIAAVGSAGGSATALVTDAEANLLVTDGGTAYAIVTSATTLVKSGAGRLARLIVNAPGTSNTLTIYDTTSSGGVSAGNEIFGPISGGSLSAGEVLNLQIPVSAGIFVSGIPAGSPAFLITYR